jgi:uncharacterized RDD family membrane protein YckC
MLGLPGRRSLAVTQFTAASSYRVDPLSGVRTRRVVALAVDFVLVSVLVFPIWLAALVLTFGLALALLPPLFPTVAFFYNGLTVSGRKMATPGMRMMGIEMRMHEHGARVPFINAAAHAVFFYLSWFFPPIFLVSLIDLEKRCVHDMLAGVTVVRRM